jgi:HEAT repeats
VSTAFKRHEFSFFENEFAHDGLDFASLADLAGEERTRAEDMLMHYLPDRRGVIGLGVLRSRRAQGELCKLFTAERTAQRAAKADHIYWVPNLLIELARALWLINPDPQWAEPLIEVLTSATDPLHRANAAEALYDVRDRSSAQALSAALDDPDALVRGHAARSLLAIHGLPIDSNYSEHMMYRVMLQEREPRESAKHEILVAITDRPIIAA